LKPTSQDLVSHEESALALGAFKLLSGIHENVQPHPRLEESQNLTDPIRELRLRARDKREIDVTPFVNPITSLTALRPQ
jgi:hypothetical protein